MTLADLKLNQKCIIKKLNSKGVIHRRFQDLGLISGNVVKCVLISPFKNPKAFRVNGIILAIRNEDSKLIEVDLFE